MISYGISFDDRLAALGARARGLRQAQRLTQSELAQRAGVGEATVKRFEASGTATLENALRLATALGADAAFDQLFAAPRYASIDEALAAESPPQRVRKRR
jgi:transcriptional regulator with XRE-family HTH domain